MENTLQPARRLIARLLEADSGGDMQDRQAPVVKSKRAAAWGWRWHGSKRAAVEQQQGATVERPRCISRSLVSQRKLDEGEDKGTSVSGTHTLSVVSFLFATSRDTWCIYKAGYGRLGSPGER
jgi:hypothetical protein